MMPMLRFFRHGDGNFALFNGMGPTPTDLLTTILAYDDARGQPLSNAPHSGYQRLEAGGAVLIMDAGVPPPLAVSQEAHAGTLAFEFSSKFTRIIVNCGLPATSRESWRQVARATAAHSTVTFNDESSSRIVESGSLKRMLQGMPIVGGPHEIAVEREEKDGAAVLRTSHDGYADSFGLIHHRAVTLSADGLRLDGEEQFSTTESDAQKVGRDEFAIRFHLHPAIKANRLTDSHGAMLMLPNKEVWTFNAYEDTVEVEESVYLAGPDGPRRTTQLVINDRARKSPHVQWTLAFVPPPGPGARRGRGEDPKLPL
jgi:uncharacterized heparinase superfamily protein